MRSVTERRGIIAAIWLPLGLVMLVLVKPAGLALAQGNPDAPSPASVTSAVIAQGVAEMPATTVAWRVVIDTAEPWGQAQFEQRALGFVLAHEDPILLTDQVSDARARLAAREADFVPAGIWQRRESLDASPTTDYRIALVPAPKASDAGGDTLIFAGNPFTMPPGARDLDLVSGRLFAGQTDSLPDTGFPTLVLATAGQVEIVAPATGSGTSLAAGQAATITGDVALRAAPGAGNGAGSGFVAAVIGPEIPAAPGGSGVVSPLAPTTSAPAQTNVGSILLTIAGCPPGIAATDLSNVGDQCTVGFDLAGLDLTLTSDALDRPLTLADATGVQGLIGWVHLAPGPYVLRPMVLPDGFQTVTVVAPFAGAALGTPLDGAFPVTLTAAGPNIELRVYLLP